MHYAADRSRTEAARRVRFGGTFNSRKEKRRRNLESAAAIPGCCNLVFTAYPVLLRKLRVPYHSAQALIEIA
jgi:hypothetical protein